jgi:hypothetical protein
VVAAALTLALVMPLAPVVTAPVAPVMALALVMPLTPVVTAALALVMALALRMTKAMVQRAPVCPAWKTAPVPPIPQKPSAGKGLDQDPGNVLWPNRILPTWHRAGKQNALPCKPTINASARVLTTAGSELP